MSCFASSNSAPPVAKHAAAPAPPHPPFGLHHPPAALVALVVALQVVSEPPDVTASKLRPGRSPTHRVVGPGGPLDAAASCGTHGRRRRLYERPLLGLGTTARHWGTPSRNACRLHMVAALVTLLRPCPTVGRW